MILQGCCILAWQILSERDLIKDSITAPVKRGIEVLKCIINPVLEMAFYFQPVAIEIVVIRMIDSPFMSDQCDDVLGGFSQC